MSNDDGWRVTNIVVIAIGALAIWVLFRGGQMIEEDGKKCQAAGGVQVHRHNGFVCIKAAEIKP